MGILGATLPAGTVAETPATVPITTGVLDGTEAAGTIVIG